MNTPKSLLLASVFAAVLLATPARAGTVEAEEPVEQVEVIGERPGPQMWKVTNGEHVVWVLGTLQPLPKKMKWRSTHVEEVLAEADEVIPFDFKLDADITPLEGVRLYFKWRRVRVIGEGATLREVLPPPLYSRLAALSARYARDEDRFDRQQPIVAGSGLWEKAVSSAGLSTSADIQKIVVKLAKKHKVKVRYPHLAVANPRGVLDDIGSLSIDAQLQCLEPMISTLESDLDVLKARAEAWAVGDVDTLIAQPVADVEAACWSALSGSPHLRELGGQALKAWTASVEEALTKNRTTLALQPMTRLLGPSGWLARLREQGYEVTGPDYTSQEAVTPPQQVADRAQ